jgi:hypothetical protein
MWWNYWPGTWVVFAPLMMLACMAMMFFMMRGMHGRCRPRTVSDDVAQARPQLPSEPADRHKSAFDEYRAETLRRLDHEQEEFQHFLSRLHTAKDKAEFNQFMAERRTRTSSPA